MTDASRYFDDEQVPTLDGANRVIESAFANDDADLASAAELVIHDLSTGEACAKLGDWVMVREALEDILDA